MKKIISILILLVISFSVYSESNMDSVMRVTNEVKVDTQKVEEVSGLDKLHRLDTRDMDSTFILMKKCGNILKEEVKMFGVKKTFQINISIFLPLVILFILFLLWLKGKTF